MTNLLMNDTFVWSVLGVAVALFAWLWWPKKSVVETLEEAKATEQPAKVEPQITDAVTTNSAKKKAAPKKAATPKKTATTTKKKTAPKKAVKKGKK